MSNDTELLTVRIAELYYDENKTQDEIGALLGVTRWKVGRLLTRARERGIVRIEIVHPRARRLGVERELRERFGLKDAVVIPMADDLRSRVAQAAADYLTALRPVPRTLGISWGRTIDDVADHLSSDWARGVTVVQINGGVSLNKRAGTAATTAAAIAHKANGQAILLPSPAILERLETKRAIEADRTVASVLDRAAAADIYLYSAGVADESSVLVESGYLTTDDVTELVRKGAVGDVVGRYIDANGNPVDPGLDERTVGLGLEQLRAADTAIFVVAGEAKHPVASAIVASGLCSVIVTDEATAAALLDSAPLGQRDHGGSAE
ncbi:MAG TPA: sugar-binding transcriptional regulator [Terrimesophilobacter sp.]|jgi:Transcriptional regulator, contains sigma factor-related N-terminal domain|uniref:sugar-binding transcriptional regulator n=1 Tax=Terrimesophilobacter sp. TaxID=2906435 RepID=UPI002F924680